jgi:hypothetical protein
MTADKQLFRRLWLRCIKNIKTHPEQGEYWMEQAKAAKVKWAEARRKEQRDAIH